MTRDEILAMPAGPEMDSAVEHIVLRGAAAPLLSHAPGRKYSTGDPAIAEDLARHLGIFTLPHGNFVRAGYRIPDKSGLTYLDSYRYVDGETAPLAICRAALLLNATGAPLAVPLERDAASRS